MREAGLEPARPEWTLEPESSESANSTTRASAVFRLLRYIITDPRACQADFSFLRLFFAFFLPQNAALPRAPPHGPHISCREGADNESVRSHIHAHSVNHEEGINKIGSLLAKTADFVSCEHFRSVIKLEHKAVTQRSGHSFELRSSGASER